jgi:7,8-dihydro-6-hydroxymethylpterin dimethyltransferase
MYTDHIVRDDRRAKRIWGWAGSSLVTGASDLLWRAFQSINRRVAEGELPAPSWAPSKMPKSRQRSRPPLGFPRTTDSLCPLCVLEARKQMLAGRLNPAVLIEGQTGRIQAELVEDGGRILMRKICAVHGPFEDVISTNPAFSRRIENLFFGRDFVITEDESIHNHGPSSIKYGRGTVLTVDLTNRCNMMCGPCFMDANQVGYVHERSFETVKAILDRAVAFKPRRQVIVLFSGGEPTLSPYFLESVAYAKKLGFYRILVATNGIRFAQSEEFTRQARDAGLHGTYLQFDGTTEEKNQHRGVANLLEVKLQAIENTARAGMKTTLVTTIVNGVNHDSIGSIVEFAVKNIDKVQTIVLQPISFAGRDEEIDDDTRHAQRYPLSRMVEDLNIQSGGRWEPMRDWFPLSEYSAFTTVMDILQGPDAAWGWSSCNCHPDCGVFSLLLVNRRNNEWMPISRFFDYERFSHDLALITDSARGKSLTTAQLMLAILRNYDARKAPSGFPLSQIINLFRPNSKTSNSDRNDRMKIRSDQDDWRVLCVEGMLFQDLWTYDFRRTEMCSIPYGTEEGEISFCAYNTGVGYRQIIEARHKTALVTDWHQAHGRHKIYARGKAVELETVNHSLVLPEARSGCSACRATSEENRMAPAINSEGVPSKAE